ncbi:MAG: c-type cytochrome [Bryobacterales bacterium]|nr:c-type cytochrome [Bryobacterales bacterium]
MRIILLALLTAGSLWAQHELTDGKYTKTDIEIGSRLYIANCIYCHGPDGDQIAGVDFTHAKFPRSRTDDEIVKVLQSGIPGTGMPAQTMPEPQIRTIVAFLRSLPAAAGQALPPSANIARGKALFQGKGRCTNCHRAQGMGSYYGPDMSDIGMQRRIIELDQALSEPNAVILPQNRLFRVVTAEGTAITGRLLNQDTFTVQLIDNKERLLSYQRSELKEFAPINTSPMPSYKDSLTAAERADLVAYLLSLKGVPQP